MSNQSSCVPCKHYETDLDAVPCKYCRDHSKFEERTLAGYTKEQHEEAAGMSLDDRFMLQHEQPCDCAVCDDIRFRRSIRSKAMPKPEQRTAWLVEQAGANSATWLAEDAPMGCFTADPNNVIRFARKQDAEAVIKILGLQAVATEHIWHGGEE